MLCTGCKIEMVGESHSHPKFGELQIDHCRSCQLVWFDSNELSFYLRNVLKRSNISFDSDLPIYFNGEPSVFSCPRCEGEPMRPCRLASAEAHWCVLCFGLLLPTSSVASVQAPPSAAPFDPVAFEQQALLRSESAEAAGSVADAISEFLSGILDSH